MIASLQQKIFSIADENQFVSTTIEVFRFQYAHNPVYKAWCDAIGRPNITVERIEDIPFLPISFFKTHKVVSFESDPVLEFTSSGTTGSEPSRHLVADTSLYEESFLKSFRLFYGEPSEYCFLALLPGYLERSGSSLVYMADKLIQLSNNPHSGFYLHQMEALQQKLTNLIAQNHKVMLLGVSFALLDLAEKFAMPLQNTIVMETGGMKGRRREMIREELHDELKKAFSLKTIHSEYGMTELFSQAYSVGEGIFRCPPWMRVLLRDSNDPLDKSLTNRAGGINVIDLANVLSCSFIATEDLGRLHPDEGFEVLGRFDYSDTRGCNLMVI